LLDLANPLEGMTWTEAARLAGRERQALHDAIQRFKAEGPDGLPTCLAPVARSAMG
jgi:hypothetical protein